MCRVGNYTMHIANKEVVAIQVNVCYYRVLLKKE